MIGHGNSNSNSILYDISIPLDAPPDSYPIWPGEDHLKIQTMKNHQEHNVHVSSLSLGAHLGTHLDAPLHFCPNGNTVGDIPLEKLIGPCLLLEISEADCPNNKIAPSALIHHSDLLKQHKKILFKTSNSREQLLHRPFTTNYTSLSEDAAKYLVSSFPHIHLIGIDYISIEAKGASTRGAPVHRTLLSNNIIILEGIDLSTIPIPDSCASATFNLICLPLRINTIEALPVRALLCN
ncbi:MAG: cyclase family protein [Oligoflexia bacterium]|nr:cyclase family protein [Oligoflexia bacterium]